MSRRTLSRTAKRLDPFLNLSRKAITGGRSDALTAHSGLDYIVAHDTSNPTVNRNGTYYSYNFGVIGGAGVDESNNILAMLNTIGAAGGGRVVIRAADPADPIHFAKTVSCYYSNVHIVFPPGQLITFEDKASLRIMGDYAQITRKVDGTAMKLHVDSTVVSNETVLELSATDTALMDAEANPALRIVRVGDKIVVRGQNDASGKSIEKDTSFVKALAKVGSYWQITCTDELDYTFKPTYPASEWPADLTTGTTIYVIEGSLLTVNSAVNDTSITVADGTVFAVGDLIEVGDNRNEYAMNSSAITGAGNPYKNPANLEQRQVVGISGNVLTLDNALVRSTSTTYYAFAALMVPVVNSTIVGARISYVADGIRSANALQITYALDCHIYDCYVDGSGGRRGHGLRISYSYKCTAHRNRIENPKYSGSGEGYGITIYYATKILVDHNYVSGCRHNFLLQLATESIVSSNYSINDLISGIDLHGVRSKRCVIRNNHVTRSKLQDSDGSTKSGGIRIGNTSHSGGDDENLIQGNYISGYRGYNNTDGNGIDIFAASAGNIIRNNTIEHCYNGLRFGLNSKQITPVQFIDNTIVEGNVFRNCENRAVEIIAAPTYDNVNSNGKFSQITFINNISDGNNRHFEFTGVVTTLGITDVVCVGNQIINPTNVTTTYYGISAKYVDGFVHVYDNNVSKAQRGIYLKGNGVCHVIGNKTANTVQNDPFTDGGGNTSINYIDAMTAASTVSPSFTTGVNITGTSPILSMIESDAATDNQTWDTFINGEVYRRRAINTAYNANTPFETINRTGMTVDSIEWAATTLVLGGTAIYLTAANTVASGIVTAPEVSVTGAGGRLSLNNQTTNVSAYRIYSPITGILYIYDTVAGAVRFIIDTSGNLSTNGGTVSSGAVSSAFDTNVTSFFGRAAVGYDTGNSDYATFAHVDQNTNTNSALAVGPGGDVFLRSSNSQALSLRVNNTNRLVLSTTGAAVTGTFGVTGDTTLTGNLAVTGNFGGWTLFTYNTDWSDYNSSNSPGRYRKVGDIVYVEGFVKRASSGTSALITTIGYGPVKDKHFVTDTNSATLSGRIEITSAGTITLIEPTFGSPATIGYVCLDGIVFSTT